VVAEFATIQQQQAVVLVVVEALGRLKVQGLLIKVLQVVLQIEVCLLAVEVELVLSGNQVLSPMAVQVVLVFQIT
jgi:hypothetical protein